MPSENRGKDYDGTRNEDGGVRFYIPYRGHRYHHNDNAILLRARSRNFSSHSLLQDMISKSPTLPLFTMAILDHRVRWFRHNVRGVASAATEPYRYRYR